jgi:hypothetical protein
VKKCIKGFIVVITIIILGFTGQTQAKAVPDQFKAASVMKASSTTQSLPGINLNGSIDAITYDRLQNKAYSINKASKKLYIINLNYNKVDKVISLPYEPSSVCVSEDRSKVYIANNSSALVTEVNLGTGKMRHLNYTYSGNVRAFAYMHIHNKAGKLFVVTGEWSPRLLVFDAATFEPISYGSAIDEIGDMAFSSDNKYIYAWTRYGWDAGYTGSYMRKYIIEGNSINLLQEWGEWGTGFNREPEDAPVILLEDEQAIICKDWIFDMNDLEVNIQLGIEAIYTINDTAALWATKTGVLNLGQGVYHLYDDEYNEYDVKFFSRDGLLYIASGNYLVPEEVVAGDINGDGIFDIRDLGFMARYYNTKSGDKDYTIVRDLNADGIIDIYDIIRMAKML